jgi:hypothetical protein
MGGIIIETGLFGVDKAAPIPANISLAIVAAPAGW